MPKTYCFCIALSLAFLKGHKNFDFVHIVLWTGGGGGLFVEKVP